MTCDVGIQMKYRSCISAFGMVIDASNCAGNSTQTIACNTQVVCMKTTVSTTTTTVQQIPQWSDWFSWSMCSVTCGVGIQIRYRVCMSAASQIIDNSNCPGGSNSSSQITICNTQVNCVITTTTTTLLPVPQWSQWFSWSLCSVTCGVGIQIRYRICQSSTLELVDNSNCPGGVSSSSQITTCNTSVSCITSTTTSTTTTTTTITTIAISTSTKSLVGIWSSWSIWSECFAPYCNSLGFLFRIRFCNTTNCIGSPLQFLDCFKTCTATTTTSKFLYNILIRQKKQASQAICGGIYSISDNSTMIVTSPNFPLNYPTDIQCSFIFNVRKL